MLQRPYKRLILVNVPLKTSSLPIKIINIRPTFSCYFLKQVFPWKSKKGKSSLKWGNFYGNKKKSFLQHAFLEELTSRSSKHGSGRRFRSPPPMKFWKSFLLTRPQWKTLLDVPLSVLRFQAKISYLPPCSKFLSTWNVLPPLRPHNGDSCRGGGGEGGNNFVI